MNLKGSRMYETGYASSAGGLTVGYLTNHQETIGMTSAYIYIYGRKKGMGKGEHHNNYS